MLKAWINTGCLLAALLLARAAAAQEKPVTRRPFGLGAEQSVSDFAGATFVYDAGQFHIDVLLSYRQFLVDNADDATLLDIGGRFFYTIHRTAEADFSVGGGIGLLLVDNVVKEFRGAESAFQIEAIAQLRAFLSPHFALTAGLGLALTLADDFVLDPDFGAFGAHADIMLGAHPAASFGAIYFF